MRQVKKDSTNVSVDVYIIDSTNGTPELGVLWNTAGMDLEYRREGAVVVNITEATLAALTTAHTDGGFLEIGHGLYRLDLPDAAVATGAETVSIQGTVTGMIVLPQTIQLVDFDPEDSVRLGLTALPNAAADAAGGLPISDGGGLDMDAIKAETDKIALTDAGAGVAGSVIEEIENRATPADVATELGTYDGPTKAEMDAAHALLATPANVATELATYDGPTHAEMTAEHAILDTAIGLTATPADVATELATYDPATKAEMDAAHALLATPAQVNDQVVDVLKVDTVTLPGQEAPPLTPTMEEILAWDHKTRRNKKEQDASEWRLFDDAGAVVDAKGAISDLAGTTTKEEIVSGP